MGQLLGIECRLLTPAQVSGFHKHIAINSSDLYGAMYSPTDCSIDPSQLCSSLVADARARGSEARPLHVHVHSISFASHLKP